LYPSLTGYTLLFIFLFTQHGYCLILNFYFKKKAPSFLEEPSYVFLLISITHSLPLHKIS